VKYLDDIKQILASIESTKQSLDFQKECLIELLKEIRDDTELLGLMIPDIYWADIIDFESLRKSLNLTKTTIREYIKPIQTETQCNVCGEYLYANSLTKVMLLKRGYDENICEKCKKTRADNKYNQDKESRIKWEQERVKRQQRLYELRTMPYELYLQTEEWLCTRNVKLRQAKYRCQVCNSDESLNVHHRTYENRGNENYKDLIVLCRNCHKLYHFGGDGK
jgi:hypothetical protein